MGYNPIFKVSFEALGKNTFPVDIAENTLTIRFRCQDACVNEVSEIIPKEVQVGFQFVTVTCKEAISLFSCRRWMPSNSTALPKTA